MKKFMLGLMMTLVVMGCGSSSLEASEVNENMYWYGGISTGAQVASVPVIGIRVNEHTRIYDAHMEYKYLGCCHYSSFGMAAFSTFMQEENSQFYWGVGFEAQMIVSEISWKRKEFYICPAVIWGHEKKLFSNHKIFMELHYQPIKAHIYRGQARTFSDGSIVIKFGLSI